MVAAALSVDKILAASREIAGAVVSEKNKTSSGGVGMVVVF